MIVDRFKDKLGPSVKGLWSDARDLSNWKFERTYTKNRPQAMKWTMKDRKSGKVLASYMSVLDLLKYDSYTITKWKEFWLVLPETLDTQTLPSQGQLASVQAEADKLLKDYESKRLKSKEALAKALVLLTRTLRALRGVAEEKKPERKESADDNSDSGDDQQPKAAAPTAKVINLKGTRT
jgi:hypothetical protein